MLRVSHTDASPLLDMHTHTHILYRQVQWQCPRGWMRMNLDFGQSTLKWHTAVVIPPFSRANQVLEQMNTLCYRSQAETGRIQSITYDIYWHVAQNNIVSEKRQQSIIFWKRLFTAANVFRISTIVVFSDTLSVSRSLWTPTPHLCLLPYSINPVIQMAARWGMPRFLPLKGTLFWSHTKNRLSTRWIPKPEVYKRKLLLKIQIHVFSIKNEQLLSK